MPATSPDTHTPNTKIGRVNNPDFVSWLPGYVSMSATRQRPRTNSCPAARSPFDLDPVSRLLVSRPSARPHIIELLYCAHLPMTAPLSLLRSYSSRLTS